jgi:hypothetical protein
MEVFNMIRRKLQLTILSRIGTLVIAAGIILWRQFEWFDGVYAALLALVGIGLIAIDVIYKYYLSKPQPSDSDAP